MQSGTEIEVSSKKLIEAPPSSLAMRNDCAGQVGLERRLDELPLPIDFDSLVTDERAPHAELENEPMHHPPLPQGQQTLRLLALLFYSDDPGCF